MRIRPPGGRGSPVGYCRFDPHGRYLLVRYGDGRRWKVWDLRHRVAPLELTVADWSTVFSPDGHLIGTIALDGSIQLYDLATGRRFKTLPPGPVPSQISSHPGGAALAVAGRPGGRVRDIATGGTVERFAGPTDGIQTLAWSPDGTSWPPPGPIPVFTSVRSIPPSRSAP